MSSSSTDKIRVLLISCTCPEPSTPALGVASIATYLSACGHEVRIFDDAPYMLDIQDENTDPREKIGLVLPAAGPAPYRKPYASRFDDLRALARAFNPDLIGVSTTEPTFCNAVEYLRILKELLPDVPNLAGGPLAMLAPEFMLRETVIDAVAYSEGEITLELLCQAVRKHQPWRSVPGLALREDHGPMRTPPPPLFDINRLAPLDFSLFEEQRLYRPIGGRVRKMLPLEVSRGCPYDCSFCGSPEFKKRSAGQGQWYRKKDPDLLARDLDHYVTRYRPEYFFIISETFLAVPESELARFCEVYGRYSTPFWMNTRPETVTEKSVKALVAVGLDRVSVGVECGNEDYRRRHLNRHHSNAVIEQAFDILHAQGIATTANIMIGLPDETPELIRESMALVRKIKPTSVGLAVFQPYKGTRLYQYALEKGYVDAAKWVRSTCYTPNMKNPFLTDNELMDALYSFSETTGKS